MTRMCLSLLKVQYQMRKKGMTQMMRKVMLRLSINLKMITQMLITMNRKKSNISKNKEIK